MYSISIQELIKRPLIRNNHADEWMNKMTDEELNQFYDELDANLKNDGVPHRFPEFTAAMFAGIVDRGILYTLFKMSPYQRKFKRVYKLRGIKFKKKHGTIFK